MPLDPMRAEAVPSHLQNLSRFLQARLERALATPDIFVRYLNAHKTTIIGNGVRNMLADMLVLDFSEPRGPYWLEVLDGNGHADAYAAAGTRQPNHYAAVTLAYMKLPEWLTRFFTVLQQRCPDSYFTGFDDWTGASWLYWLEVAGIIKGKHTPRVLRAYHVAWIDEYEAETALDAATQARLTQLNPDFSGYNFVVTGPDGIRHEVYLHQIRDAVDIVQDIGYRITDADVGMLARLYGHMKDDLARADEFGGQPYVALEIVALSELLQRLGVLDAT